MLFTYLKHVGKSSQEARGRGISTGRLTTLRRSADFQVTSRRPPAFQRFAVRVPPLVCVNDRCVACESSPAAAGDRRQYDPLSIRLLPFLRRPQATELLQSASTSEVLRRWSGPHALMVAR